MLSTGYVETMKHKEFIQQAFEERTPISVKVVNVVRDGVIATYKSIDIYIHRTQLELSVVDDLEPYRDQEFDILVTQFDPNRRRMRVSGSRRMLLQQERKESEREIWDTIEVGNEYPGVVRNLTNFGAFVDIGGVDGLIHISEMSWQRIRHPSEVLSVGDKINVFVKDFDRSKSGFRWATAVRRKILTVISRAGSLLGPSSAVSSSGCSPLALSSILRLRLTPFATSLRSPTIT